MSYLLGLRSLLPHFDVISDFENGMFPTPVTMSLVDLNSWADSTVFDNHRCTLTISNNLKV